MNIGWIMPFLGCALWAQGAASQDGEVGNGCADLNRRVIEQATMGQLREAETALAEAMGNSTNRHEPARGGLLLNNLAFHPPLSALLDSKPVSETWATGSRIRTVAPSPGALSTKMLPPLCLTIP